MTEVISSIVIEVSATLVDTTIFLRPDGGRENTRFCSWGGREAWRGRINKAFAMSRLLIELMHREISAIPTSQFRENRIIPGRKMRIPPLSLFSSHINCTVLAINS